MQNDVLGYAYEGIDSMAEDGAMPKLRAIAGMYPEVIQLVALKSSNINTIADLKGKKVCVATRLRLRGECQADPGSRRPFLR